MSSTTPQKQQLGIVARVGGWAAGHRRLVLLGWIVALVGAFGASSAVGTNYSNSFSLKGTDSQRAVDLLKRNFPAQSGDSDQIVFRARSGSVTAPAVQPVLIRRGTGGLAQRSDRVRDGELRSAREYPAEGGSRTCDLARRHCQVFSA
jgi:RND superfamily putative drug exporter